MGRAILSRSYEDLEAQILRDPQAPMETFSVHGFTTLQLCAGWPQGLQKLLKTEAESLLDTPNISVLSIRFALPPIWWALRLKCAESVDLLMRAGCSLLFNDYTQSLVGRAAPEVLTIVASRMADRRRSLLDLAQREIEDVQHEDPSHVADGEAAYLCQALEKSGVSIPQYLNVGWDYTTIYHYPGIPICHFRTYFDQGFRDLKLHNKMGLTPIMVWRETFHEHNVSRHGYDRIVEALVWLNKQGSLDQKADDPWKMGLNIYATGWHYVAAMLGSDNQYVDPNSCLGDLLAWEVVRKVSQVTIRDCCACWCNPEGKGCSPLKSFLNAHPDRLRSWRDYEHDYLRHIFFHHDINITGIEGYESADPVLQLIRFLTFEALEMTHTCCALKRVNVEQERLWMPSEVQSWSREWPAVIASCDSEMVQTTRSDKREQENAHQLDTLMEEFTAQLRRLKPSSKALESFVWGYWRRRISELFTVDIEFLDETERVVKDVRTCEFHTTDEV